MPQAAVQHDELRGDLERRNAIRSSDVAGWREGEDLILEYARCLPAWLAHRTKA